MEKKTSFLGREKEGEEKERKGGGGTNKKNSGQCEPPQPPPPRTTSSQNHFYNVLTHIPALPPRVAPLRLCTQATSCSYAPIDKHAQTSHAHGSSLASLQTLSQEWLQMNNTVKYPSPFQQFSFSLLNNSSFFFHIILCVSAIPCQLVITTETITYPNKCVNINL